MLAPEIALGGGLLGGDNAGCDSHEHQCFLSPPSRMES
jgi:hypothetical protein